MGTVSGSGSGGAAGIGCRCAAGTEGATGGVYSRGWSSGTDSTLPQNEQNLASLFFSCEPQNLQNAITHTPQLIYRKESGYIAEAIQNRGGLAAVFPLYRVIVLAGRQPACVLFLVPRKNISQFRSRF